MDVTENIVKGYFGAGLQHKEIISLLETIHNINLHPKKLKRMLSKLGLFRRKHFSSIVNVVNFIKDQMERSGQLHGNRWMHLKCIQHGLVVTEKLVREVMKLLDPEGVDLRKRKRLRRRQYINSGPNAVWHVDSYDKIKPYGICINGAIDGFSRHIIWLCAGRTASDPKVVAGYYVNAMKRFGGCPATIRSDMGTENVTVEKIQTALRNLFARNDNRKAPFIYGRSTANQRIESWWCILRKQNAQFWINFVETLKDENLFNATFLDKSLIQFCFLDIIQKELDEVVFQWNTHRIQATRNCRKPVGRPIMMYEAPSLYGARNGLIRISQNVLNCLNEECTFSISCDAEIATLCRNIMRENNYESVEDPYDAAQLYVKLRTKIYSILESLE